MQKYINVFAEVKRGGINRSLKINSQSYRIKVCNRIGSGRFRYEKIVV